MVNETAPAKPQPAKRKKDARLSKDGKWRLFPSDNHLLQYVSTGTYFGRVKVGGKTIRRLCMLPRWTRKRCLSGGEHIVFADSPWRLKTLHWRKKFARGQGQQGLQGNGISGLDEHACCP